MRTLSAYAVAWQARGCQPRAAAMAGAGRPGPGAGAILGGVPSVASLEDLRRAVTGFSVEDLGLVIEPPALAAARRSLDESCLLLLGEVHGVRENPLVIRAVMLAFGLPAWPWSGTRTWPP